MDLKNSWKDLIDEEFTRRSLEENSGAYADRQPQLMMKEKEDEEEEEEVFPTTRAQADRTPETNTTNEPPKLSRGVRHRSRQAPNELGDIINSVMKCLNFDDKMFEKEEPETTQRVDVKLDYLGEVIKLVFLGLINVVLFISDQISFKIPMIKPLIGILNFTKNDVADGQWNDLFSIPDENIKSLGIPVLHTGIDIVFEMLYYIFKYNRISLPMFAFYLGAVIG